MKYQSEHRDERLTRLGYLSEEARSRAVAENAWMPFVDEEDGRLFYYNFALRDRRNEPPETYSVQRFCVVLPGSIIAAPTDLNKNNNEHD